MPLVILCKGVNSGCTVPAADLLEKKEYNLMGGQYSGSVGRQEGVCRGSVGGQEGVCRGSVGGQTCRDGVARPSARRERANSAPDKKGGKSRGVRARHAAREVTNGT
eukprot:1179844-Prorocentrum_minimum.AAC.2